MKAVVSDRYVDIFLSDKEAKEYCKLGHGKDTCSWLVVGSKGFECAYYHRHSTIIDRREKGTMIAMRDGCKKVKEFNQFDMETVEF